MNNLVVSGRLWIHAIKVGAPVCDHLGGERTR